MIDETASGRRQGAPLIWRDKHVTALSPVELDQKGQYQESFIQEMVDTNPETLPLASLEPALADAASICTELSVPSGFIDNVLMTPRGDIVLIECKLWRNPEARRAVVGQIIDYAKDLQKMTYEQLEKAVRVARKAQKRDPKLSLYELAGSSMSEVTFIDRVSLNLRTGRAMLLIVGDGITEELESIAGFLQRYAGLHFSLALVQLAVYEMPDGGRLIVPSVPMRTTNIERGIVTNLSTGVALEEPVERNGEQSLTLTEEQFFAELDRAKPGTSAQLRQLIKDGGDFGLEAVVNRVMILRFSVNAYWLRPLAIAPDGVADVTYLSWAHDRFGALVPPYLTALASHIAGAEFSPSAKGGSVRVGKRSLTVWDILANAEAWIADTRQFRHDCAALDEGQ